MPWQERYNKKVDKRGDCWIWKAARRAGYGAFWYEGRHHPAHRVAWMLKHGEFPPDDMLVCHKCDNPECVNPDHLFLGTHADNNRDCAKKGRGKGQFKPNEQHPNCRLSDDDVREIRAAKDSGKTHAAIAAAYGVNQSTVTRILNGRRRGG